MVQSIETKYLQSPQDIRVSEGVVRKQTACGLHAAHVALLIDISLLVYSPVAVLHQAENGRVPGDRPS